MLLRREIFKREWCALLIAFHAFCGFSQDTTQLLPTVPVVHLSDPDFRISQIHTASPTFYLNKKMIEQLGSVDVGEALKFIPGTQIKDYGGVGGIRTVSYRSLGSAHTGVVIDGNYQLNTQTGSINLSQFESFGLYSVRFCTGQPDKLGAMPTAYLPAQTIQLSTDVMFPDSAFNFEFFQNAATVNSFQTGFNVGVPFKNGFFGAQLFSRYGSGEYDYQYDLTGTDDVFTRLNSKIENFKARIGGGFKKNRALIEGIFYFNYNDQQLPGAVVLFNPSNDQSIRNNDYRGDLNFNSFGKSWITKVNGFVQSNYTLYEDPNFLNQQGFWRSEYQQSNYGIGAITHHLFSNFRGRLVFGADGYLSQLSSNEFSNAPSRIGANSLVSFDFKSRAIMLEANLTHQFIYDEARSGDSLLTRTYSKFTPYAGFRWHPLGKKWFSIRGFYKRVFRMPSFNDLYYNFIGNTNLLPEDAHLFNFGLGHEFDFKSSATVELGVDGFYNLVKNKIVAIPTKDVFNWSMQNIGRTRAIGLDASIFYAQSMNDWTWSATSSLTLNYATDITDSTSSSYGHQIPYTPILSTNGSISVGWKGYTLSNNVIYSGERWSLSENIAINHLDPFIDWNIGVSKEFEFATRYKLFVSAKIMNVLGNNYEVVRSFPMPGRYYQFTLKFKYN